MTGAPIQAREGLAWLEVDLSTPEAGPKRAQSLISRHVPLASTETQLNTLAGLTLDSPSGPADFEADLGRAGWADGLRPAQLDIFQINIGKLCNMTCRHCHVDAGPDRVHENMDRATIDLCLAALDKSGAHTVDITGGAPELNAHFRYLVDECVARGKHVIDRCNLSVLLLPKMQDLPEWLAERGVEIVCSLPHYRKMNTDAQRGDGSFEKSIAALQRLNAVGYGQGDPKRRLVLMHNPAGAYLASNQATLEREWKAALQRNHGITFDALYVLNNMPISRFLEWLMDTDNLQSYMESLVTGFNPSAVANLMCRNTLSVSWDGRLYDCDFNQMLDLESAPEGGKAPHVRDFDLDALAQRRIVTARHCYGCTAGAGSSCGGATT